MPFDFAFTLNRHLHSTGDLLGGRLTRSHVWVCSNATYSSLIAACQWGLEDALWKNTLTCWSTKFDDKWICITRQQMGGSRSMQLRTLPKTPILKKMASIINMNE